MTDNEIEFGSAVSLSDIVSPNLPPDDMHVLADAAFKRVGLVTKWRKREIRDEDGEERYFLRVGIPNGRQLRWIAVTESRAQFINSVCVRPAIALGEYEALLYTDTFEIEAQLRPLAPFGSPNMIWRLSRLPGVVGAKPKPDDAPEGQSDETDGPSGKYWALPFVADSDQTWSASIGTSTDAFTVFRSDPYFPRGGVNTYTLKLVNTRISRHDEALDFLERVGGAILFEADLRYGIALSLSRISPILRRRPGLRVQRDVSSEVPRLPRNSYPGKPLALYWYARSAANMPLLQYLASYQVLEYYFPTYYRREALDRLKRLFEFDRDAVTARLLWVMPICC